MMLCPINTPRVLESSPCCVGATFAEFAQYVVDEWSAGRPLDRHWRPQNEICRPCYVHYDFIGRFERLGDDAGRVLARLTAADGPAPGSSDHSSQEIEGHGHSSGSMSWVRVMRLVRGARLTAGDGPAPGSNVTFPVSNSFNSAVPLSQHRTDFYANVSRDVLRKLVQLYKVDYELFDYDYRWACDDC